MQLHAGETAMKVFTVIGFYDWPEGAETYANSVEARNEKSAVKKAQRICRIDNGLSPKGVPMLDIVGVIEGSHQVWCPGDD